MNPYILALIGYYSALFNVDPRISVAVAQVESNFNSRLVGSAGEIGIFQLSPESFPNKNLKNIEVNIREGIKYLAWNKKYCSHKNDIHFLVCYNYGIENAKKVKHPEKFPYILRVKRAMKELNNS